MKLRNRKTYMNTLPEGAPPENVRPRITQIIYYLILLTVLGYVIYIFGARFFYFKEKGFVEIEKTIISSSRGGKILRLMSMEGQKINKKDLIAVIAPARHCQREDDGRLQKMVYDIALNRVQLGILNKSIYALKNKLSDFSLMRALETGQQRQSERESMLRNLEKDKADAALLTGKIVLQKRQLASLTEAQGKSRLPADCYAEVIGAPFNGVIHSVKRKVSEFSARGAPLVTLIADKAPVRIESYLDNDQLRYLHRGNVVNIKFADGVRSKARINKIFSSANEIPERDWVHYRPVETQVRVHLVPVSSKDAALWKRYDRMEVTVRGGK